MIYTLRPDHIPPGYCDQSTFIAHDRLTSWGGEVKLNANCLYDFKDTVYNKQCFKIRGKGYGYNHHDWSVRLGGRRKFQQKSPTVPAFTVPLNKFEIFAYLYNKNQLKFSPKVVKIFEVEPEEVFDYFIDCDRQNDTVTFTSPKMKTPTIINYLWNGVPLWGAQLFPFMVGSLPITQFASMEVSDF